jgi:serine/threonine-protein kinase
MGEVYRADDLELGQTVALKLVPSDLAGDQASLDVLRNEVRVARHISHPNVCRVYDIGEVDGQYFVSMEYVDGEDLASLLRRIGRLSKEKGLDIIVQLAAGLAAAHHLDVLHRDLKPANVMVDGHGRVRIMDFGLAGFTEEIRGSKGLAGTLSYMAPEQLAGKGATARSDVYALGLVMYELLTGRRAYGPGSVDELRKARAAGPPEPPSSFVSDLDPAVERVVLWCLEAEAGKRPGSAQVVAKALPGGDPLAVALAAGETPSPEMVAAAGGQGGMRPITAILCLAGVIIGMLFVAGLNNRMALFRLTKLDKPPVVLADRARQVLAGLGLEQEPRATAFGLGLVRDLLRHIETTDSTTTRWERLRDTDYPIYLFWYKESPRPLIPFDTKEAKVSFSDPPMMTPGMAYVRLTSDGRLLFFETVGDPTIGGETNPNSVDWLRLFEEAGIEPAGLEPVEDAGLEIRGEGASWQGRIVTPGVPVDHMEAWIGRSPWGDQDSIKVRAGAFRGRPVFFAVDITFGSQRDSMAASEDLALFIPPPPAADETPQDTTSASTQAGKDVTDRGGKYDAGVVVGTVIGFSALALALGVLIGGPLMAWRHLRAGKGDRRGAVRFGLFALGLLLTSDLLLAHHAVIAESGTINMGYEINMIVSKLGTAVLYAAYIALAYLALEPYVRRHWPDALISWTRLVGGRIGDPLVGRDMLLGSAVGVLVTLIWQLRHIVPVWFGWPPPQPITGELAALQGGTGAIGHFLAPGFFLAPMLGILSLVLLVIIFRRRWVALAVLAIVIIWIGAFAMTAGPEGTGGTGVTGAVCFGAMVVIMLALFLRSGLLALTVTFFFLSKMRRFPLALDSSVWYSGTSTLGMLALAAIAIYAFRSAIRGHPGGGASGADSSSVGG